MVTFLVDTEKIVDYLSKKGVDFCDARFEKHHWFTIMIINGEIRSVSMDTLLGVSIRVLVDGSWGYASTTNLSWESIKETGDRAYRLAKSICGTRNKRLELEATTVSKHVKAKIKINPIDVDIKEKLEVLMALDKAQRDADKRVVNSNSAYSESISLFNLSNSLGANISWNEIRTRIVAYPIVAEERKMQSSFFVRDGTKGFELIKELDIEEAGRNVAKESVELLSAKKPPSGLMTVIIDPSVAGVLAHEVMGHASEADEVIKNRSFLTGIIGKKVGSELVTMIDDGTIEGANGTIPFDSEGTESSRTVIIENGVYKGYMHSLETAAEMGVKPTGNGRAQDFNRRIFVRMTNTFFEKGEWRLDEIIEDTKDGLLALKSMGGMEDPVGGGFETRVLMGYVIKNGEKQDLVRGFTLSGKALEILKTVDAVGREFELHGGQCGKGEEDYVYVGIGGPYMRAKILVGGG